MLRDWLKGLRKACVGCAALAAISIGIGSAGAGDNDAEMKALLEQQAKQIQELKQRLDAAEVARQQEVAAQGADQAAPPSDEEKVRKIVGSYLAEVDAQKKAEDAAKKACEADQGYKVGSDLKVTASFNDYGYLWLRTPHDDFTMHIGYWVQYDNVFWDESPSLRVAKGAARAPVAGLASGTPSGGINDLEDGMYFRRIRPFLEGTFWENYEYRLNLAMENIQNGTAGLDEFWVGANKIPIIGTIRAGHVKTVEGFEGDMSASSRTMTFMERSSYSEAIEMNQNFQTGLWFENNYFNQHATYSASVFRVDNGQATGASFGDGQWGAAARLTCLPIYECDGRDWLHLGISAGWRNGSGAASTTLGPGGQLITTRGFELRARPELRDDDPAAGGGGATAVPNSNDNRLVDTGIIQAADQWIFGTELCWVRGPFSVQAEYGFNVLDRAIGIGTTTPPTPFVGGGRTNYVFQGGYLQLAYTLTGEARGYDRARGTLSREYFRTGDFTNAWLVNSEDGHVNWGWGAVELAARYSYTDLNSGSGNFRIQGGQMNGLSLGINWYLNSNLTWMFDWVYDDRYDLPNNTTGGGPTTPGWTSGFGTRVQLSF